MAVWRWAILLTWTSRIIAETTLSSNEVQDKRNLDNTNVKEAQESSLLLKPSPGLQPKIFIENNLKNSSTDEVFLPENFPIFRRPFMNSSSGWIPTKRAQILLQNSSLSLSPQKLRPRSRRRKIVRIRRPLKNKNLFYKKLEAGRKPKLFLYNSSVTFEPVSGKNDGNGSDAKMNNQSDGTLAPQADLNDRIAQHPSTEEDHSFRGIAMPVHVVSQHGEKEENSSQLLSNDTFIPRTVLETAPFKTKNSDFSHYNASNLNQYVMATSKIHPAELEDAFEDFNSNMMNMFPLERRGGTLNESLYLNESNFGHRLAGATSQGPDRQSTQPDSYTNIYHNDGHGFSTLWRENFGPPAVKLPQRANASPDLFSDNSDQFLSSVSTGNEFTSREVYKFQPEERVPPSNVFSHAAPSSDSPTVEVDLPTNLSDDVPDILYQYRQPTENLYDRRITETPARVENVIKHMKSVIHGNQKVSTENIQGTRRNDMDEMLEAANSKISTATDGLSFDSRFSGDPLPPQTISSDADYDYEALETVEKLNERIRNKQASLRSMINQKPLHRLYKNKFPGIRHEQRQIKSSGPNYSSYTKDIPGDFFAESEQLEAKKEKNLKNVDWETIFSSHFRSPESHRRKSFRTSFKKLEYPSVTANDDLGAIEHVTKTQLPEVFPAIDTSAGRFSESYQNVKFGSGRNFSSIPSSYTKFDSSPWKPAYPMVINKMKVDEKITTGSPTTKNSMISALTSPGVQYTPSFTKETNLKPTIKTDLRVKNLPQNMYAKNNFASSWSNKLKQFINPLKKQNTEPSWSKKLFDYVSGSFFSKGNSKVNPGISQSSPGSYFNTRQSKKQKWPRIGTATTDAPVVGSTEYLTVTAVAALGTLASMVLLSLNDPFGGRRDSQTKQGPDPLVDKTLKFISEAAEEYKNFTEETGKKSGPLPIFTSEFKYPEYRINKDYVDQMLSSINEKHTVNMKNNLALFVSNAYRLLKKYPSDTGIIKLVNSALQLYKKIKGSWESKSEESKQPIVHDNDWQPLSEDDLRNMMYLMHEMNELQKLNSINTSLSDVQQNNEHLELKNISLNDSNETAGSPVLNNSDVMSSRKHTSTPTAFSNLQTNLFTNSMNLTEIPNQETVLETPKFFPGNVMNSVDEISNREHRSKSMDGIPSTLPRLQTTATSSTTSPLSDLLKLDRETEPRRVIINNILKNFDKVYPDSPLNTNIERFLRPIEEKNNSQDSPALRGIFINNELHVPSEHLYRNSTSR